MTPAEKLPRYHLFGDTGGWNEFHYESDTRDDLDFIAAQKINEGYQVMLEDREEGTLVQLKLQEKKK